MIEPNAKVLAGLNFIRIRETADHDEIDRRRLGGFSIRHSKMVEFESQTNPVTFGGGWHSLIVLPVTIPDPW